MLRYDPDTPVDPKEWMALDEDEREHLVERYHRKKRIKMPDVRMHAMIHVVVKAKLHSVTKFPLRKPLCG